METITFDIVAIPHFPSGPCPDCQLFREQLWTIIDDGKSRILTPVKTPFCPSCGREFKKASR
jgi:hypothetical protein